MGAYYKAVLDDEFSIKAGRYNNGQKLMEHSYIDNDFLLAVESKLLNNSYNLCWLCDYHEADEIYPKVWDEITEYKLLIPDVIGDGANRFIINYTKEIYFSTAKVIELYEGAYPIHPLPILCNSELVSAGGGDYHPQDSRRATWCNDQIGVLIELNSITKDYKDVSADVLFYE